MHVSNNALTLSNLSAGFGAPTWSPSHVLERADKTDGGSKMRALGNAAALLVTLTIMAGLIVAQRDYQNSWHQPDVVQGSTATATHSGAYKLVMK